MCRLSRFDRSYPMNRQSLPFPMSLPFRLNRQSLPFRYCHLTEAMFLDLFTRLGSEGP